MDEKTRKFFTRTKDQLDSVSPSFCVAKWSQVTMHLHNGRTHSCHHPPSHQIPIGELAKDPSALHNTDHKKEQRRLMMEGKRPAECQYCWNVEDLPQHGTGDFFSDRVMKSSADWSQEMIPEILASAYDLSVIPRYAEVSFSNICNLKCSYCSPVCSSRWVEEMQKHGAYPTSTRFNDLDQLRSNGEMPIHHKEHNPYVEAFWKWWPELSKNLKVFRITGGEPLLADDTFKALDLINNEPKPEMVLGINTNACVPDQKITELILKAGNLLRSEKIKKLNIFTSVDGHGKAAEYGRFGLDYQKWIGNVDRMLTEMPGCVVTIMSTVNILSVTSYDLFLADMIALKEKHGKSRLSIDIAILRYPRHQCLYILTDDHKNMMDTSFEMMRDDGGKNFHPYEVSRMQRLVNFMKSPPHTDERINLHTARRDFIAFVDEHDRRRGTNFLETFPGLEGFYQQCKKMRFR